MESAMKYGELEGNGDLEQFGGIIDQIASKYSSLEKIGIDPAEFAADARGVVATHVNNICADRINTGMSNIPDSNGSSE